MVPIRASNTNVCIMRRSHRLAGETAMATTTVEPSTTKASSDDRPISLPPGPKLPMLMQTALLWCTPDAFLSGCLHRYGPTFTIHSIESSDPLVYVAREEDVKAVFTGDPDTFRA